MLETAGQAPGGGRKTLPFAGDTSPAPAATPGPAARRPQPGELSLSSHILLEAAGAVQQ